MLRRLPIVFAACAAAAFAQRYSAPSHYGSPSGFGSILYPGVGHAPNVFLSPPNSFPSRLGATVRGGAYGGYGSGYGRGTFNNPGFNNSRYGRGVRGPVLVPVPVIIGGGYYGYDVPPVGYYDQAQPIVQQQQQSMVPPVVIINQNYRPDTANPVVRDYSSDQGQQDSSSLRRYDAPVHPMPDPNELQQSKVDDQKPTIYLIAFKDHTILPALAYWVEGDTLNYISTQGTRNQASLTLIDRDFSKQLNRERNLEFALQ